MTTLLLSFLFISNSASALSKGEALLYSKSRIESLSLEFAAMSYTCFVLNEECQIQGNTQEATLKLITAELGKFPARIEYGSGKENFFIDGALRIAKTGNDWGGAVVFNEDLLVKGTDASGFSPLGFFDLMGILIHEYGHHQTTRLIDYGLPPLQHQELDQIAVKVVSYLRDRTHITRISSDEVPGLNPEYTVNVLQTDIEWFNGVRNIWSHLFVDGISETKEISHQVLSSLACPVKYHNGHIVFKGYARYAAFRQTRAPRFSFRSGTLVMDQDIGEASVLCIDSTMNVFDVFDGYKNGHLRLVFSQNEEGKLLFQHQSSRFTADLPIDGGGKL